MSGAVPGRVALVGGGPGPLDLLTVRALRLLRAADVVIADRLGPAAEIRAELRPDALVVDVGKRPGHHPVPQERISALLVEHALAGRTVVRLKGGDPFVLGRGGEEVLACRAAGIEVEVVPGISSSLAVPQAAGIPVTHRGTSAGVHVVSGHDAAGPHGPSPATLAALADDSITTVVLMGVRTLPALVAAARAHGVPGERPVAIIENGHTPLQRTTRTTLERAVRAAEEAQVRSPAVIVIGEVARPGLLGEEPPVLDARALTAAPSGSSPAPLAPPMESAGSAAPTARPTVAGPGA
ncbi:uroporphyrinogen-III C-methyltransferase [Brachybacterium paraconglomeratum]|uniref:uroporphyrinogen-III C-methyltransferase n=1 Tax=Brachybacterium paraconglomeratum TaxID=173362 RepID=UPI0022E20D61|nr:uroporphyrinogen-III C-methyltransferase [Brachybacterium paraconglomeratum]